MGSFVLNVVLPHLHPHAAQNSPWPGVNRHSSAASINGNGGLREQLEDTSSRQNDLPTTYQGQAGQTPRTASCLEETKSTGRSDHLHSGRFLPAAADEKPALIFGSDVRRSRVSGADEIVN